MTSYNEKAIKIAISLLKRKSPENIQKLKSFLTFIPNPNHIKDVLVTAVIELIETHPESAFWLFQYSELLDPEIQVKDIIVSELTKKLFSWGYTSEDFYFTNNYNLLVIKESKKCLLLSHQPDPDDEAYFTLIYCLLMQ
ncbi:MAG TPA: hypothetical protein V6D28_20770 [Leptolyngbyaceae cyanobacterium]